MTSIGRRVRPPHVPPWRWLLRTHGPRRAGADRPARRRLVTAPGTAWGMTLSLRRRRAPFQHRPRMVDRHRERQPVTAHVRGLDDADRGPVPVEQRSTAVARIDRGVGLHQRGASHLSQTADDAARDRVLEESERCADGDDFLADADSRRRSQWNDRLTAPCADHLQHGDIERRRRGLDARRGRRPVRPSDRDGSTRRRPRAHS